MKKNITHLTKAQLSITAVDEADLPEEAVRHLRECVICAAAKRALEQDLVSLGRLAEKWVPDSRALPSAVGEERPGRRRRSWLLAVPGGAAIAAALAIALWFAPFNPAGDNGSGSAAIERDTLDNAVLFQVNPFLENNFSQFHDFLLGGSSLVVNEDFLRFLLPENDPGIISYISGGRIC